MINQEIEAMASAMLERYQSMIVPVPVEKIAVASGAMIARNHFSGNQSGFALRQGSMRIIGVNTTTSPRRQRFTIGHELGHLELHVAKSLIVDHSYVFNRDEVSSLGTDREEVEANGFAAALLMPRQLIVSELQKELHKAAFSSRDELIGRLARAFDVSNEAMGYRLINLSIISA
ncbi:ImmA/IrrE family metallo-endopeptidase [Dactylosporangium sp. CA-052675]|uniref:ImmA/IrrE family metallo-endopeptidase n=1 Tax=Dactylosporangium sp. CA-052675 TaxID=3239927 RepID=UPI003D8BCDC3